MARCGWKTVVAKPQLKDRWGRIAEKLRISVTDRCNFRCTYCMPESGITWLPKAQILSLEEIFRLVKIFVGLGISELRLTGGEPLLRKDLESLIAPLKHLPLKKIAITTNGYFLPEKVTALYQAGLRHFNLSLDSLLESRFFQIARRPYFQKVLQGIESLSAFPDCEIKINTVVIRGWNEDEVIDFAALAREKNLKVRFIEFMPLGAEDGWKNHQVVAGQEIYARIQQVYPLEPLDISGKDPASRWRFADHAPGELGFINSVSRPFCQACNRIRLTADGQLRNCLFSLQELDLKTPLRAGASDPELAALIQDWVYLKESGHLINQESFERPLRSMSQIGG